MNKVAQFRACFLAEGNRGYADLLRSLLAFGKRDEAIMACPGLASRWSSILRSFESVDVCNNGIDRGSLLRDGHVHG
jgi:hypothetical protein